MVPVGSTAARKTEDENQPPGKSPGAGPITHRLRSAGNPLLDDRDIHLVDKTQQGGEKTENGCSGMDSPYFEIPTAAW
jgi:hypothetical protein